MVAKLDGRGGNIRRLTPMGSSPTRAGMNGKGSRRLSSWIDEFVEYTSHIDSPEIFRRWTAITTIAAVLEQKVWGWTTDYVYPNMYTFLVGHPGVGKTRTIKAAQKMCETLDGFI